MHDCNYITRYSYNIIHWLAIMLYTIHSIDINWHHTSSRFIHYINNTVLPYSRVKDHPTLWAYIVTFWLQLIQLYVTIRLHKRLSNFVSIYRHVFDTTYSTMCDHTYTLKLLQLCKHISSRFWYNLFNYVWTYLHIKALTTLWAYIVTNYLE